MTTSRNGPCLECRDKILRGMADQSRQFHNGRGLPAPRGHEQYRKNNKGGTR